MTHKIYKKDIMKIPWNSMIKSVMIGLMMHKRIPTKPDTIAIEFFNEWIFFECGHT